MLLRWLLVLMLPLLSASCAPGNTPRCKCRAVNRSGRCFIDNAAPQSFKCLCSSYRAPYCRPCGRKCKGVALPCRNDEACPGGRYSYCACVQGGGQCSGYQLRPSTVNSCSKVNKLEVSSSVRQYSPSSCNCYFYDGGCHIVNAAPEGFKCLCQYFIRWGCEGLAIGCDEDEYCPADDHTYCGCRRGGGNCEGYSERDKNQVCDVGSTCDCDRSSDWTKGRYSIAEVSFDADNIIRSTPRPVQIGHVLDLPNASGVAQSQRMTVVNTMTSEMSFERTHGVDVALGLKFSAINPIESLAYSATNSFKFGEKTTTSNQTSHWYTCNSPPKTHTRCTVFLMSSDATVPYTMILEHNAILDCQCRSYGNWKSTISYFSQKFAEDIGPCHRIVSGKCVTQ